MRRVWVWIVIAAVVVVIALGVGWRVLSASQEVGADSPDAAVESQDPVVGQADGTPDAPSDAVVAEPALQSVSGITEALSTAYGMSFQAGEMGSAGSRSVHGRSLDPSTGAEVECVVWSVGDGADERIVRVEATVRSSEDPGMLDTVAAEYLGFCAQSALTGTGADAARIWVEENVTPSAGAGDTRTMTVDQASLEVLVESAVRYLIVEFE